MPSGPPAPAPPFARLLIANRGEIAVRLIRACRELGISPIAVYSEADADAPHVRLADAAVLLGPPPAAQSYLDMGKVIAAARQSGAGAVHPGYGFLSENAEFARRVEDAGLVFIGPPADAIARMGDKAAARALMEQNGVPVVPGAQALPDDSALAKAARAIGYPVLVKAAAGGGGKGMRVVHKPGDLAESAAAARREALHAFGDDRLILEKYLAHSRHIEFQILADRHGNTLHLFERECSIQRRHQKVIEETPSPLLDDALRRAMGAAAVAAARAVDYTNAGTVEFIVDPDTRAFYFLEMNTRLQVEHPITEAVTGLDLARWQIRIAAGEPLPFTQDNLHQRGHAIECRLYAEDPASGFLPAAGRLLHFQPPSGPGVRVDSGVQTGSEVGVHYDPLLAKLIVHAEDRPAALQRMQTALAETIALGLATNREFLQDVLAHPVFIAGQAATRFIEDHLPDWRPQEIPAAALIAAALAELHASVVSGRPPADSDPHSPWARPSSFRLGGGR
ncbi:MAG: acetyl-CoA carboxylase biotin carboxylase subunit [Chloroflexi bacterium]|nr:acetyl-CoA carboxylase biotin carboxylase subunit [Chloroflexota bacterium]